MKGNTLDSIITIVLLLLHVTSCIKAMFSTITNQCRNWKTSTQRTHTVRGNKELVYNQIRDYSEPWNGRTLSQM